MLFTEMQLKEPVHSQWIQDTGMSTWPRIILVKVHALAFKVKKQEKNKPFKKISPNWQTNKDNNSKTKSIKRTFELFSINQLN